MLYCSSCSYCWVKRLIILYFEINVSCLVPIYINSLDFVLRVLVRKKIASCCSTNQLKLSMGTFAPPPPRPLCLTCDIFFMFNRPTWKYVCGNSYLCRWKRNSTDGWREKATNRLVQCLCKYSEK